MSSKFLVPLHLADRAGSPSETTAAGFIKAYIKNGWFYKQDASNTEYDLVLARTLDNLLIPSTARAIISGDTVLSAFANIQKSLNSLELKGDVTGTAVYSAGEYFIQTTFGGELSGFIKSDGSVDFTGVQSMGGFNLTNLAEPVSPQDAVTKAYADAIAASAHDPVTLGTANGLSLSTQILSLDIASGSTTGALSSTDWTTFNNKAALTDITLQKAYDNSPTASKQIATLIGKPLIIKAPGTATGSTFMRWADAANTTAGYITDDGLFYARGAIWAGMADGSSDIGYPAVAGYSMSSAAVHAQSYAGVALLAIGGASGNLIADFQRISDFSTVASVGADGTMTALKFVKTGGTAAQFLKANGTVDTNVYLTSTTGVPSTRTITVNGVAFDLSANRQWRTGLSDTGALTYAGISVTSATQVNIGAVTGIITNNETNPAIPSYQLVTYAGGSNITVPTIAGGTGTYVLLNSAGALVFQNTFPTSAQRKSMIYLSKISHPNLSSISFAIDEPDFVNSPLQQFRDLFQVIQYMNQGVIASGNAGLTINTSNGTILGDGINFVLDKTNPNTVSVPAGAPRNFLLVNRSGATGSFVTTIDPANYDVAGVTTAVGGGTNRSTIQYLYYAPGVGFAIQRGQTVYNSLTEAVTAVGRETFVLRANLVNNSILIAAICLRHTTTAMNDTNFCRILSADKFGQIGGAAAGVSVTSLQTAYNNSLVPQIITTAALGAVTIKNGGALDTDNVFAIQNLAGTITASIDGNGAFTGTGFIKSGGTLNQFLKADGSVDSTTYENTVNKGIANGYASLDSGGKIPTSQLPNSVMEYKGVYDASTNTPILIDGTGNTGDVYRVTVAGAGVNSLNFIVGDYVVYNGTTWEKQHSGADNVVSVFGRAGVVTALNGDYTTALVTETTNKNYQTDNQKLFNDATSSIQTQLDNKAPSTGSANYIQNQNVSAQAANMWISGGGRFGTLVTITDSVQASLDLKSTTQGFRLFTDASNFGIYDLTNNGTRFNINSSGQATFASTVTASNGTLIGGTLTTNYLPKATGANSLGNSLIYDDGTNVGIGTTDLVNYGGYTTLTIGGENSRSGTLALRDTSTTKKGGNISAGANGLDIYAVDITGYIRIFTSDLERLRIANNGNVLIGTTTDTGNKLRVVGGATELDQLTYGRAISITSGTLNTYTTAGFFSTTNTVTISDRPFDLNELFHITVEVHSTTPNEVHQTATSTFTGYTYSRHRDSTGTWFPWQEILTTENTMVPLSGNYTPSFSNISNVAGVAVLNGATYQKIGDIVSVTVGFHLAVTTSNTLTSFSISLPYLRATTDLKYLGSGAGHNTTTMVSCFVLCDSTTNARVNVVPVNTANNPYTVTFQYNVNE